MTYHCPHLRFCPGCPRFDEPYPQQLLAKATLVRKNLARVWQASWGQLERRLAPTVASPEPLGYRISAKLALHQSGRSKRAVGIYEKASKRVVDIPDCPVQDGELNRLFDQLLRQLTPPAPFYDHGQSRFQPGRLKFAAMRRARATGDLGLVISHTGVDEKAIAAWVKRTVGESISVYASRLSAGDKGRIFSEHLTHLCGPATMRLLVGGHEFALPPQAFFQANGSLLEPFVAHVTADAGPGDGLLDLFGGFGAYSFALAKQFSQVFLVDTGKAGIAAARAAKERYGYQHLYASAASCEDFLAARLTAAQRERIHHVIVNPPREGLSEKLTRRLDRAFLPQLRTFTYVSCNPETLARDLALLGGDPGFCVTSITPFDMFPQTGHVETVLKAKYLR